MAELGITVEPRIRLGGVFIFQLQRRRRRPGCLCSNWVCCCRSYWANDIEIEVSELKCRKNDSVGETNDRELQHRLFSFSGNGFYTQYAHARDIGLDCLADRVLEIAETLLVAEKRVQKADGSVEITTADAVDRSRLTLDSLCKLERWLWLAPQPVGLISRILQIRTVLPDG